jgi:hypothetical protein
MVLTIIENSERITICPEDGVNLGPVLFCQQAPGGRQNHFLFQTPMLQVELRVLLHQGAQREKSGFALQFIPGQRVLQISHPCLALSVLGPQFGKDIVKLTCSVPQPRKQVTILLRVVHLFRILPDVIKH